MSQKSLAPVLSCLQHALAATRHGEASDRELLERYLTGGDSSAFVALLNRHGQRVFATCRRVLHREADVEDAFQATFLVLLNKARSVRWEPSLAGWLAAVAHRIAVRTRCQAVKRSGRETQGELPETALRHGDELLWREACAILHEELDRLPDEFRLPLVLCYLEGLSRDEAAQTLGCSLDVVKGRLERGRAKLRARLERRGVSLTAGLLGVLGVAGAAQAAEVGGGPLPQLIQVTMRTASTGQLSARVSVLVHGGSCLLKSKLKLLAATVLALTVVSGVSAWLYGATTPRVQQPHGELPHAQATSADEVPQPRQDKKPAEPPKDKEKDAFEINVTVVGPDGKPYPRAKIFSPRLTKEIPTSFRDITAEQVGTTDANGKSRVAFKPVLQGRGYLIAQGEGLGIDFVEMNDKSREEVTLKLVKDQPITGRIVDTEGKPLAGVTVSVESIYVPAEEKLDNYLAGWKKTWRDTVSTPEKRLYFPLQGITGVGTTDKDGRFKLTGVGVERIAHVAIHGGGAARSVPYVITRAGFDPKPYNDAATAQTPAELRGRGQQPILYGPDFTFVVALGKVVEGVVKDAASGKPLEGVRVGTVIGFGDGMYAVTDKEGKYRFEGLPPDKLYHVRANPLQSSLYLRRAASAAGLPGPRRSALISNSSRASSSPAA